jgi:hypothetical protein
MNTYKAKRLHVLIKEKIIAVNVIEPDCGQIHLIFTIMRKPFWVNHELAEKVNISYAISEVHILCWIWSSHSGDHEEFYLLA